METNGYKLYGHGSEKVIVMHSWLSDCSCYDPVLPYLSPEKFTYAFMDLRGYGHSKEREGQYTAQEASDDVICLANALSWERFHLIGHSMSGMVVQKVAVDHPQRIKSVVAITPIPACGSPSPPQLMEFLMQAADSNDANLMECAHLLTGRRYSDLFAKKIVSYNRKCSTSTARIGYLNMFSNTDFSASVKGLKVPIVVIYGRYDAEGSEIILRNTFLNWYPNARMECCEGAGHFPMQETPIYLASRIEKFISEWCYTTNLKYRR